jgi:restriction system protein
MAKRLQAEFPRWFGPLLYALRDLGDSGRPPKAQLELQKNLSLGDEVLDATLKSGASRFRNQVAWARQQHGLIPLCSSQEKVDCPP